MAEETFETFVQRERARLHSERETIHLQKEELEINSPFSTANSQRSTPTKLPNPASRRGRGEQELAGEKRAAAADAKS